MTTNKAMCTECDWHGMDNEVCQVKDPGGDQVWLVCPDCRAPEHILSACEHDGCWKAASCGTPKDGGYLQTCGKHAPKSTFKL